MKTEKRLRKMESKEQVYDKYGLPLRTSSAKQLDSGGMENLFPAKLLQGCIRNKNLETKRDVVIEKVDNGTREKAEKGNKTIPIIDWS